MLVRWLIYRSVAVTDKCIVDAESLERNDVQLFLIKCPAGVDPADLFSLPLPVAGIHKRARLTDDYEIRRVVDAEASQIHVLLPGEPSDEEEGDEDKIPANLRAVRHTLTGTLQIVQTFGDKLGDSGTSAAGKGLHPVELSRRKPVPHVRGDEYKYLPVGYGSEIPVEAVADALVDSKRTDKKAKKGKKTKRDKD